jgi:hypothetical protein
VGIPFYARPRVRKGDTRIISKFLEKRNRSTLRFGLCVF